MQQRVSSLIIPEQHESLLISWSPHSTDKTATVIVWTIVKLHCCPIVKLLCKFQFRERGFAGNCTNLYLILPYDDFSGSSSAVRAEGAVFDSKRDSAFTEKCTETKIFVSFSFFTPDLCRVGVIFPTGINWVPVLYELVTNLWVQPERCFYVGCCSHKSVPPIVCPAWVFARCAQMKFSPRVCTLLHRKRQLRTKYKPVS